jgi:hypothetical protein
LKSEARKYRVDLTEDVYSPEGLPSASFSSAAR